MPAYQIEEILIRIGLALLAGVLIGVVPIAYRKGRFAPHAGQRIFLFILAAASLIGFCFYVAYLWKRFVPRESAAPAPISYPVPPRPSAAP
jgi:hypothetical protein